MCLDQEERVHGLWIHPGQVRWCGDLKPPPVEPTVCVDMSQHVEMVDADTEDLGWLRRLRSCLEGRDLKVKRHRLPAALETCSTHIKRTPGKVLDQCCPGSAHQPARSPHEGGTHWHDATGNARHAKVGCPFKTTGILRETRCERGMAPGTSSLPGSAERRRKCRCWCTCVLLCRGVPMKEGTGRKQGWWAHCMSQGTSGEWETGKPLGVVRGLLVFRV